MDFGIAYVLTKMHGQNHIKFQLYYNDNTCKCPLPLWRHISARLTVIYNRSLNFIISLVRSANSMIHCQILPVAQHVRHNPPQEAVKECHST